MRKDLFTFLIAREVPNEHLNLIVKKDIQLSFRKKEIILKFIGFQILGALFSLSFCPQFGLGMNNGHNISHFFMQFGMWACAAFCGSLFLSTGAVVAFLGMKGEELWWVWRRYGYQLIFLPAVLWSGLMLFSPNGESLSFHVWWILAGIISAGVLHTLRTRIYSSFQLHPAV
ncbi:MAG: hypothetical protein V4598_01210 [Bdellovibrionota bacterium]